MAKADRIFALEHQLAERHATREDSVDVLKANNPWRRADFARRAPGLDWDRFFAAAGLARQDDFIVWHPGAVIGVAALVAAIPVADWKDYLVYHAINHHAALLPKALADEHFAFYGTVLAGTPQPQARPKRAIASASDLIGDLVGQVYVAKYFPPASKARIGEMVRNIVAAFERRVANLAWMAPATKEQAIAKLKVLYVGIGYPDRWIDYTGLKLDPADAVGNAMRAEEFLYRRALAKLGQPVDRTEWCMVAQLVNAVNMPLQNALDFPAGILQPPYFDPSAPDAVNYGGIGAIIGHEISHSFDDQGSQFDQQGRLRDWWTAEDAKHFREQSAQLVAQYNAYRPLPDLAINGQLTLSENIADLAGLAAAYDAFQATKAAKSTPTAGPYTDDQLFFLAYAQAWRSKSREPALRNLLLTNGHAPAGYRALTVRNLDAWYTAFGVNPGQKLYLEPGARVRVW
jgi:putative endopeptidase